jgi:hypothetical protein
MKRIVRLNHLRDEFWILFPKFVAEICEFFAQSPFWVSDDDHPIHY